LANFFVHPGAGGVKAIGNRMQRSCVSNVWSTADDGTPSGADSARSIGAYCFSLGESGVVSWCTRKQKTVAQSSCDAEYIAVSEAARATPLLCDNQAALVLAEDPSFHTRAKHINTKLHYIRECTQNKQKCCQHKQMWQKRISYLRVTLEK